MKQQILLVNWSIRMIGLFLREFFTTLDPRLIGLQTIMIKIPNYIAEIQFTRFNSPFWPLLLASKSTTHSYVADFTLFHSIVGFLH